MNIKRIKHWANGNLGVYYGELLVTFIIVVTIIGITYGVTANLNNVPIKYILIIISSIILFFINLGLSEFTKDAVHGRKDDFLIIFSAFQENRKLEYIKVYLLEIIYIAIYLMAFIIPGIMRILSYSLVKYICIDSKYKDLSATEKLQLSEKIMKKHRWELFLIYVSFLFWHILSIFTVGLLELYVIPYQQLTISKYLVSLKDKYEEKK